MHSKAWKVSASVLLALRPSVLRDSLLKVENTRAMLRSDQKQQNDQGGGFHILTLRRGETDKHLPGIHVFPGGHLDEADTSPAWIDLFRSLGYEEKSFMSLSTGGSIEHSPEYKEVDGGHLPGWMSLRLCAIRETFEESGILLCRSAGSIEQGIGFTSFFILNELEAWQKRVRADPRQMIALCESAECVPDLWGLHLWSNWLTPTQQRIRHNSVFFLSVLQSLPPYSLDSSEMDELKCCSPLDLIIGAQSGKLRLANPQFYEAARLSNFSNAESLISFASNRAQLGCCRTMPVQERAKDGMLFLLPGDSAYPKTVDYETSGQLTKREESLEELRNDVMKSGGTLHRTEVPTGSPSQRVIVHNYVPPYEHISPPHFNNRRKEILSTL
ncbi:nucleoside diphosphate-linked moiety X motif 19-like [Thrips palmi]|uniref:Nucleoside diphosphate-linked moiety X motif 19-like n=1 Tax=Thrips palmi TaxID=161013 RepID=A0A6P9A0S4_THRPL|nr:nucleoside diphosphate-linked moiety X motif 19-like [Thrips palmi]